MTDTKAPYPVKCKGCLRSLGTATSVSSGVTCSRFSCTTSGLPAATIHEGRDGILEFLQRENYTREFIATVSGVTVQRVGQILAERRL